MCPARIDCQVNLDIQWAVPGINTVVTKISPATQKSAYYDLSVARCSETERYAILSRMDSGEIRVFHRGAVGIFACLECCTV
jgi:hypothetical protein